MKETIAFSVSTTGTEATLFLFNPMSPTKGEWVKLKRDAEGKWKGEFDLNPGTYGYSLNIRAGKPKSAWTLSIQRSGKQPLQRKGALNDTGDGGRVGEFTFA